MNHTKESKIQSDIHIQDQITEEMNSYKARYAKQQKELQEARKDITRYKNSYEMCNQSLNRLTKKHAILEHKYNNTQKEHILVDMSQKLEDVSTENKQLQTQNQDLQAEIEILKLKIDSRAYATRSFGGITLFEEPKRKEQEYVDEREPKGSLLKSFVSNRDSQLIQDLKSKNARLESQLNQKKLELNSLISANQKMASKIHHITDELNENRSALKKCEFYSIELSKITDENKQLKKDFLDVLKENSDLVSASKARQKFLSPLICPSSDFYSEKNFSYLERMLTENTNLKLKLKKSFEANQKSSHDLSPNLRFESKRREIKEKEKKKENVSLSSDFAPKNKDVLRDQVLEKRKGELEAELVLVKQKWALEKEQLESENSALKDRIDSIAKNYQDLQSDLQAEKEA